MRNFTLDVYKCIACFLVIYIHSFVRNGETFLVIARIAVPIFFMITGFYYPVIIEKHKERCYFFKIFRLTLFSTILYAIASILYFHTFQINSEQVIKWLVLNVIPFTGGHLWYLYALIYVLIISKILRKRLFEKNTLTIILFLLGCNYCLSFDSDSISYRNSIFTGLPYFLSGFLVNRYQDKILKIQWPKVFWLFLDLVLCSLLFLEYGIYKEFNCYPVRDHYFMLYPLSLAAFCYAIRYPDALRFNLLCTIGNRYSTDIYIYHLLFILVGDEFMYILKSHGYIDSVGHGFLYPFIIMVIVVLAISMFRKINFKRKITEHVNK